MVKVELQTFVKSMGHRKTNQNHDIHVMNSDVPITVTTSFNNTGHFVI